MPTHQRSPTLARAREVAMLAVGLTIGTLIGLGPARATDDDQRQALRSLERIAEAQADTARAQADTARAVAELGRRCR